jgi:hypothetical protein
MVWRTCRVAQNGIEIVADEGLVYEHDTTTASTRIPLLAFEQAILHNGVTLRSSDHSWRGSLPEKGVADVVPWFWKRLSSGAHVIASAQSQAKGLVLSTLETPSASVYCKQQPSYNRLSTSWQDYFHHGLRATRQAAQAQGIQIFRRRP